ncbi:MAG: hypothetical protein WKG01_09355 [Kofleriaceae bacterium]
MRRLLALCERVAGILSEADLLKPSDLWLYDWLEIASDRGDATRPKAIVPIQDESFETIVFRELASNHRGFLPLAIQVRGRGTVLESSGVDRVLDDALVVEGGRMEVHRVHVNTSCDAWMTHDLMGMPQPGRHELNAPRLAAALARIARELQVPVEGESTKRAIAHPDGVANLTFADGGVFVPNFDELTEGDYSSLTLDYPRYVIGARLRSGAGDEVREGYAIQKLGVRVLITLAQGHTEPFDALKEALALDVPGIAPLRWLGEPNPGCIPYAAALIEELPPGGRSAASIAPLSESQAIAIGAACANVLVSAHAGGLVVGGICPETIYLDEAGGFAALVPRGPQFIARAPQRTPGLRSYQVPYEGHEVLALGKPGGAANDVFALCATLQTLVTGRHPFGSEFPQIMQRVLVGAPDAYPGELGKILARGLAAQPELRPTAPALAALLRTLH